MAREKEIKFNLFKKTRDVLSKKRKCNEIKHSRRIEIFFCWELFVFKFISFILKLVLK